MSNKNTPASEAKIISDKQILHRAESRGPRVTRVQVIENMGLRFEVSHWHDGPCLLRVDSRILV